MAAKEKGGSRLGIAVGGYKLWECNELHGTVTSYKLLRHVIFCAPEQKRPLL